MFENKTCEKKIKSLNRKNPFGKFFYTNDAAETLNIFNSKLINIRVSP